MSALSDAVATARRDLELADAWPRPTVPTEASEHLDMVSTSLKKLLAALSTPPADDVREALDADVTAPWPNSMHQVWERLVEFSEVYKHERGYPPNEAARTRFLFTAFEVRPHGTVTDAEPVAWAIYGLESHRFLRVQEAVSDNDLRYYNVRPLFAGEVES